MTHKEIPLLELTLVHTDIKSRPSEKPLSLWLGSIDDIKTVAPEGKGWSPKLFAFMESIWPGSVSLVVSRGEWLQRMGVGTSAGQYYVAFIRIRFFLLCVGIFPSSPCIMYHFSQT